MFKFIKSNNCKNNAQQLDFHPRQFVIIFAPEMKSEHIQETFGNIDIYLFDQLIKGTYDGCKSVLDAGCGTGRNLLYFLKSGAQVYGVDQNPEAIAQLKNLASAFPHINPEENFRIGPIEQLPFENESFDLVVSSAVLHFAENQEHFEAMLSAMWRVLKPGGYFFCRLASEIGIESLVRFIGNGRYILPDGSERFLVNQEMLVRFTNKLGGKLHEPIKTTNVQNMRAMTTWCVRK
ncbi:class I SAM-dependent methyltransferase [Pedobacter alluvionis]|uniref:Methyltransferase family protein n=2 Tax=Pedobacter alluvionis TaxID=475253 RepID=A0A497YI08_9SPHI|nr:class I SAM-dependent methyltransferase [Pedobacter alluvionis]RLJ81002.1 methyltransferase family protein [Pedobacter alluvionis]